MIAGHRLVFLSDFGILGIYPFLRLQIISQRTPIFLWVISLYVLNRWCRQNFIIFLLFWHLHRGKIVCHAKAMKNPEKSHFLPNFQWPISWKVVHGPINFIFSFDSYTSLLQLDLPPSGTYTPRSIFEPCSFGTMVDSLFLFDLFGLWWTYKTSLSHVAHGCLWTKNYVWTQVQGLITFRKFFQTPLPCNMHMSI